MLTSERDAVLAVWEYDRDLPRGVAVRVALEGIEPPDLRVTKVASTGDTITVSVIEGTLGAPDSLLYVERHGMFEILRLEPWPGGVRLTLGVWTYPAHTSCRAR